MIPVWLDRGHEGHAIEDHLESSRRLPPIELTLKDCPVIINAREDPVAKDRAFTLKRPYKTKGDCYWTAYTADLLKRGKQMIEEACANLQTCAFVLIRPPGHHSDSTGSAEGFCHQNNAWIAVQTLKELGTKNITILDWDAHHGDGTEDNVVKGGYTDVRFCSLHAFGPGIYPETGEAKRTSTILNVPLPVGTRARSYERHFNDVVMPWILEEKVEVLIVSAGYDGHADDPMELLKLDEDVYRHMSKSLKQIGCKVLFLLEGGYNPKVLGDCVKATLEPWF